MGNQNGKAIKQKTLLANWEKLPSKYGQSVYKNIVDGVIGQKITIFIDKRYNANDELQIYRFRRNNNEGLVKTYQAEVINQQQVNTVQKICYQSNKIQVIHQKINKKLMDMPQLTFPQSLYVLRESLKAYQYSYNKIGPFHINDRMICINSFGEVKSWVNQNLANNHPDHQKGTLVSTSGIKNYQNEKQYQYIHPQYRLQSQMVRNLVDVVQNKCQSGRFPKQFSDKMYLKGTTFSNARGVLQDYVNEKNIRVPNKILQNHILIYKKEKVFQGNIRSTEKKNLNNIPVITNKQSLVKLRDMAVSRLVPENKNQNSSQSKYQPLPRIRSQAQFIKPVPSFNVQINNVLPKYHRISNNYSPNYRKTIHSVQNYNIRKQPTHFNQVNKKIIFNQNHYYNTHPQSIPNRIQNIPYINNLQLNKQSLKQSTLIVPQSLNSLTAFNYPIMKYNK